MTDKPTAKYRILAVDDDPVNLQVVVNHLSMQNIGVIQAAGGMEALQKIAAEQKPDLVLLDIMLPGMNGFEFFREIIFIII